MRLFGIDYETFWDQDYTLNKLTTEAYVRDPRFQTIGVAVTEPLVGRRAWLEHHQFRAFIEVLRRSGEPVAFLAHHAHFDGFITSYHYGYAPTFWYDTLSIANAVHGPGVAKSLEKLCELYNIGHKGKEVHTYRGKRREDFTDWEWQDYGRYSLNDADLTWKLFGKLYAAFPASCRQEELDLMDAQIRCFTEPELVLDVPRMTEYLQWERSRKAELLARTGEDASIFKSNDKFAELLLDYGIEPEMKLSPAALKKGETKWTYAFAKSDSFMKGLLEHDDVDVRTLAECRIGLKSTINETRTERYLGMASRGPLPVYYRYAAAHTYRNGGGDKSNWTNHERTNKKNPRKGTIRKSVQAPPGKALVVFDSSQIEARTLAGLAGEQWLIDAFAQGRDIYSEFATDVFNRPIDRKTRPEDELPGFVGKVCILGLGFQMGWPKLAMTFLAGALGGEPVQFDLAMLEQMQIDPSRFLNNPKKVERAQIPCRLDTNARLIHCMVSEEIVKRYRKKNKRIEAFWGTAEEILQMMLSCPEGQEMPLALPIPLAVVYHGIKLPNGMVLRYPGLECRNGQFEFNGGDSGRQREHTYGGKITENIVQALARIIVMYQILAIRRKYGYKLVLTTYDEGVMLVDEANAPLAYQQCLKEFQTPPWWAPWLPIAAEGGFGKVYGEIK